MNNDLFHSYFTAFKLIGESTELKIFRLRDQTLVESHSYDHADFDGISAIVDLARKNTGAFTPPTISFSPEPGLLKKWKGLVRWYLRFWPFKSAHWKNKKSSQRISAWRTFPNPSNMSSGDLNTKLLLSLDQASRSRLSSQKARMWMVPVSLYDRIDQTVMGGNRISFIDVRIDNESTTESIKKEIRGHLKSLVHWGTLLTLSPAKWVGVKAFSMFLKTAHYSFRRTGTLTNMGEWKIPRLPENEWWVFGDGMVVRMNPMVATAMIVNGTLGVSLIAHETLGYTKEDIEKFMEDWRRFFLTETNTNE